MIKIRSKNNKRMCESRLMCRRKILQDTKQRGFGLVELLIYVALTAVLMVAIVNAMILLTQSYRTVKTAREIESSAIALMDRIIREARRSPGISSGAFDVNNGSVTLETGSSTASTVTFFIQNERGYITEGTDSSPLTDADVRLTSMTFSSYPKYNVQYATSSVLLKVDFTLESGSSSPIAFSKTFYGSAILRGSYDFQP